MNPDKKTQNILVATIQLEVSGSQNQKQRTERVNDLLSTLTQDAQKPDLILLPEIWGCGFFGFDGYAGSAEPLQGPTFELLSRWAETIGCWILGGSIIERDGKELYNTSILLDRQGRLTGTYRKVHLFGYQSQERELLTRGKKPVVLETEWGKIGLSTCYDLRFPEQYRAMVDEGAETFLVVSAWPEARLHHWRLFNQARAAENQCWLVSCNCAGTQGKRYGGHSMTVSPTGDIVAEADDKAGILWSKIDMGKVREARETFPVLKDRT